MLNPYIAGNPVGKTQTFVGRSDILRSVIRVLKNPSQSGLVLFGQRRIGKTSLLDHLDTHLHSNKNSFYATVVFDLQDKAKEPLESVLISLSETIAKSLELDEVPDLGLDPRKTFRDEWLPAVMKNLSKNKTLVLLFDEFDVLADHNIKQASEDFFPYFRQIISQYPSNLKFIFVLGRNIADINGIARSFLKILESKHISLLSENETAKLVRLSETLNNSLKWPDDAVDLVWNLTNGHPYLTQSLCSQVWEALHENEATSTPIVSKSDVESAVELTLESSRSMLEWLWDGLGPAERVAASALAEAGPITVSQEFLEKILHDNGVRVIVPKIKNAPELLEEWDLIQPVSDDYKFRVELLRQWIQKYKRISRIREELKNLDPSVNQHYEKARKLYYEDLRTEEALNAVQQAIKINPYYSEANLLNVEMLTSLGRFEEANQYIEQMELFDPKNARLLKINNLLEMAQRAATYNDKVRLYNEVLDLDPEQPDAIEKRAKNIKDQLENYFKKEQTTNLENLISSNLLNESEILKAQKYIEEIQEKREKWNKKIPDELEDAEQDQGYSFFEQELPNEYPSQITTARKTERREEFARFQERSDLFQSALDFVIERTICFLAGGLMWVPALWIIIAIKNNDIVIGRTMGFANYYTQSIWAVVILWFITSLFIIPKDGFRLEQTCASTVGILTPFIVPAMMLVGLRGEPNKDSWYYFGLTILVLLAIISGHMVVRYDNNEYEDDGIWRFINILLAIAFNISIIVLCFIH